MIDRLEFRLGRPSHPARSDMLSDLLAWVRVRGEIVYHTCLAPPWHLGFSSGASHIHFVEGGRATLLLHDGQSVRLERGDLVLLPHGLRHDLLCDPTGVTPAHDPFDPALFDVSRLLISNGETGEGTRIIGGLFHYERLPLPPILQTLPTLIRLKPSDGQVPPWLNAMSVFLMDEMKHPAPGSALMLSRIIDLMVIRTLRAWVESQEEGTRWLGGGRDERLSRALTAMHDHPAHNWSVAELANLVSMSRSAFADRFARVFGQPPMRYLMRWRFTIAAELLADGRLPVNEVARRVGYDSEPGFSRAFKTVHGLSPSLFRTSRDDGRARAG